LFGDGNGMNKLSGEPPGHQNREAIPELRTRFAGLNPSLPTAPSGTDDLTDFCKRRFQ
jgi:hypothetical protein